MVEKRQVYWKGKMTCSYCNLPWHNKRFCPKRKKDELSFYQQSHWRLAEGALLQATFKENFYGVQSKPFLMLVEHQQKNVFQGKVINGKHFSSIFEFSLVHNLTHVYELVQKNKRFLEANIENKNRTFHYFVNIFHLDDEKISKNYNLSSYLEELVVLQTGWGKPENLW